MRSASELCHMRSASELRHMRSVSENRYRTKMMNREQVSSLCEICARGKCYRCQTIGKRLPASRTAPGMLVIVTNCELIVQGLPQTKPCSFHMSDAIATISDKRRQCRDVVLHASAGSCQISGNYGPPYKSIQVDTLSDTVNEQHSETLCIKYTVRHCILTSKGSDSVI